MNGNKIISILLVFALLFAGCAQTKLINGVQYEPYGVINSKKNKKEGIDYDLIESNIILSIIFCETLVVPFVLIGFKLFQAVKLKEEIQKE